MKPTQNHCPITGRPLTQPGTIVHPDAWGQLPPFLTRICSYLTDLEAALGKQFKHEPGIKNRATGASLPINLTLLEPVWIVRNDLEIWTARAARHLAYQNFTHTTWHATEEFWQWALTKQIHKLCAWEEAPEAIDALRDAWRILIKTIDRPGSIEFIGVCPDCSAPLYLARPRKNMAITCRHCHQDTTAQESKAAAIRAIGYLWLPADQALYAAALLTGQQLIPRATLDKWVQRGHIETRPYRGRNLYQPKQLADRKLEIFRKVSDTNL